MAATGYSQFTIHPGWQAVGDSSLICLGPAGDVIKRFTISPSDTNVGTMIADAQAAAKAAADAAAAAQKVRRR